MKKHSMPEMKEGGVNVTPLIDIVMCLIVFFMLVTKIGVSRGVDKDIKLPSAIIGMKIADMGNTLSLNIHHMPGAPLPQVTTLVEGAVKELKMSDGANGNDNPLFRVLKEFKSTHGDKAKIIFRGDQELEYQELEKVLIAVNNAGIVDTAYETKSGPGDAPEVAAAP